MSGESSKTLQARLDRRRFLKGSGLAAAVFASARGRAFAAATQDQGRGPSDQKGGGEEGKQAPARDSARDPNAPTEDVFLVVHKDDSGRDYRVCPQCGFNMYQQDRTWTCENCGFSYSE